MRARWRRTRPWARVVAGAVVLAVVATGAWWLWWRDPSSAQAQAPTTRTVQASLTTMEKTVAGTGTLTPTVDEDVSFVVSGTVTRVAAAVGDTVKKGQKLAEVDTLNLDADLLAARSTLAQAKARLADVEDADDGSDSSDAQIAAAQAQVDVAQAGVDDAKDAVGDAVLTAPVAGLVTSVDVAVGDVVSGSSSSGSSSGTAAGGTGSTVGQGAGSGQTSSSSSTSAGQFVIVGTGAWQVTTSVSESDVANVSAGDQVELTSDDLTDTLYGTVASVGLFSTSTSGVAAYPVVVDITGDTSALHDGTSVDVSIIYERRTDVLTIPALAVSTADDVSTVTVQATDGTQKKATVTTGETSGNLVEITSGLSEGDSVVLATFQAGTGNRGQSGQSGQQGEGGFPGGGIPGGGEVPGGFGSGQGGQRGGGSNG